MDIKLGNRNDIEYRRQHIAEKMVSYMLTILKR